MRHARRRDAGHDVTRNRLCGSQRARPLPGPFAWRYDRRMILERLEVTPEELQARTGWEVRPEGACKGDRCVPLPGAGGGRQLDVAGAGGAARHGAGARRGARAVGARARSRGGRALASAELPPTRRCPTATATRSRCPSLRGHEGAARGVGLVVRMPLRPARVAGAAQRAPPARARDRDGRARHRRRAGAGPWIDLAKPEHPSLIDQAHLLDELLGVVNVPNGVWIDEQGMIVRPPEPAFPGTRRDRRARDPPEAARRGSSRCCRRRAKIAGRARALRRGAARLGRARRATAVSRSRPTRSSRARRRGPPEVVAAAACFELGQHLHRAGHPDDAVPWFREAHRLQPDNWTYKRQAWEFVDPILQGPSEQYDGRLAQRRARDRRRELLPAGRPLAAARCVPDCSRIRRWIALRSG